MNNEPDYNNLAFEPEMTMQDVFKFAVDNGWAEEDIGTAYHNISKDDFVFYFDGDFEVNGIVVAEDLTPAKMKLIIEGLM